MTANTEDFKKGTTILGIVCKDGAVLASERRATAGTMIMHTRTQKLFKIANNIGMTVSGLVGDAQVLVRYLSAEAELYRLKRDVRMPVQSAATLMSNILNSQRIFPYWVGLLIGGVDDQGAHVYSLDAVGGAVPDKYASTGSGSPFVYGVLEDHYYDNMPLSDGVDLAIQAVTIAMRRDAASGDGIDVASISEKEFKIYTDDEIKKRVAKLKL